MTGIARQRCGSCCLHHQSLIDISESQIACHNSITTASIIHRSHQTNEAIWDILTFLLDEQLAAHLWNHCSRRVRCQTNPVDGVAGYDVVGNRLIRTENVCFILCLRSDKGYRVNGIEGDSEKGIQCIHLLNHIVVLLYTKRVNLRILNAIDITKEEGIKLSVVAEDIKSILHSLCICSMHAEY